MRYAILGFLGLTIGLVIAVAAPAHAQGFDVQRFKPVPNQQDNYFTVHSVRTLGAGQWEAGLVLNYANDPLVLVDDNGDRAFSIVSDQITGDLVAAIGILERWEFGLALPVVLLQEGDMPGASGAIDASDAGFGVGDLHLASKVLLFNADRPASPGGAGLAFVIDGYLPTGDEDALQGEGVRVKPGLVLDYAFGAGPRISLEAGYLIRPERSFVDTQIDDAIALGTGLDIPFGPERRIHALAEVSADVSVAVDDVGAAEVPLEFLAGGRYFHPVGVMFEGGFGMGLNAGFGSPDYRVVLGATYRSKQAEPEPVDSDSDGDGLFDSVDRCPNEPEDKDAFEDENGCPDPDNDGDGLLDAGDQCPNEPEDKDTFEDENGCPDPDNDGDGLLDAGDQCPNEAEDKDGFEDENGCPDPDNDQDGLLDAKDVCVDQPEDLDGFEDADGCPEDGSGKVRLTCDKIEIKDKVFFDTGSDRIQERSFDLLDQIAGVLKSAVYIKRLRIEGHTDNSGNDAYNLQLSDRRAASVRRYLSEKGIEEARLESVGLGETQPIADNKSATGRGENRRVEFLITERDTNCEP